MGFAFDLNAGGVDSVGGVDGVAERDVGGGVAEVAASLVAFLDGAVDFPIPAEDFVGGGDVAVAEVLADAGGGIKRAVCVLDFFYDCCGDAGLGDVFGCALAHLAEAEIVAYYNVCGVQAVNEDVLDEILVGLAGEVPIEGEGVDGVYAFVVQAVVFERRRGETIGRVVGFEELVGVGLES